MFDKYKNPTNSQPENPCPYINQIHFTPIPFPSFPLPEPPSDLQSIHGAASERPSLPSFAKVLAPPPASLGWDGLPVRLVSGGHEWKASGTTQP